MEKLFIPVPEDSKFLGFIYTKALGRILLKPLSAPILSRACGRFLDSRLSKALIRPFINSNGIDMDEYEKEEYGCFNDFFTRRIRKELRPVDYEKEHLIAPCDGLLSAYHISDGMVMDIKHSRYSVNDLLRDEELAACFDGGTCLVFRLCVNHYHRYAYIEDGIKGQNIFIPGVLHTVRPIALRNVPVFKENSREYTIIETGSLGRVVQMEVGAMLVGRIANLHQGGEVRRGEEKGRFLYGGSTVVVLLQKDRADIPEWVFEAHEDSMEIPVKLGECIGSIKENLDR